MTYRVDSFFGTEVRCEPGEIIDPTGVCDRHTTHHWCETCQGYYGVPRDGGMHEGPNAHPNQLAGAKECVCRMCVNWRAEIEEHRRTAR